MAKHEKPGSGNTPTSDGAWPKDKPIPKTEPKVPPPDKGGKK